MGKDLLVPLMSPDPNDIRLFILIWIITKEHTPQLFSFNIFFFLSIVWYFEQSFNSKKSCCYSMCVMVFLSIKGTQEFINLRTLGYSLHVSIKPTLLSFSDTKEVKLLWRTSSPLTFHPNNYYQKNNNFKSQIKTINKQCSVQVR